MPRKKSPIVGRRPADENMVVSTDQRSIRKGRRAAPRTAVCRPCLIWAESNPEEKSQGVVMDLNPHGMRIRALDPFAEGTLLFVQMMRDEEFSIPLSAPISVRVMRAMEEDGFHDHGVKLELKRIRRVGEVRLPRAAAPKPLRRLGSRMFTVEYTADEQMTGRPRR